MKVEEKISSLDEGAQRAGGAPSAPTDGVRLPDIDHEAFARELDALKAEIDADLGHRDIDHLKKLERWGRLCTAVGYATAWIAPNPLSAALISLGQTNRWCTIAHHVLHRGLDKVPGVPERYTSKRFAAGSRRFVDWLDWLDPEAWSHEHNVLHHYRTGELDDPDFIQENAKELRDGPLPIPGRYVVIAIAAATWKYLDYAPRTFSALARAKERRARPDTPPAAHARSAHFRLLLPLDDEARRFWRRCLLPYAAVRFAAIPALFLPLGPLAAASVLANSLAAEALTNLHTFLIQVPNHAGTDLHLFEGRPKNRGEFYVRQVLASTNYATGNDVLDFLHGCLNYQIEHHLWPDLPPLRYREAQPRVKALCEKYGLPYVQESVWRRAKKTLDVMVGKASMRVPQTTARGGAAQPS